MNWKSSGTSDVVASLVSPYSLGAWISGRTHVYMQNAPLRFLTHSECLMMPIMKIMKSEAQVWYWDWAQAVCVKVCQLLAIGWGFLHHWNWHFIDHYDNHCLDMTLAVAEALSPNKPNQTSFQIRWPSKWPIPYNKYNLVRGNITQFPTT